MENTDVVFDRILHSIGDNGKFQKRFNFIFTFLLCVCSSMTYMNLILAMTVPDHWCYVPGRGNTTYSLQEWKDMHIPREADARGKLSHSNCKMYNLSVITDGIQPSADDIISCQYGFDYDHTWYTSTVPTSQDWVCEKELYATNVFAAGRIGEVIGAFVLGQLGDYIGRRPVCLISMVLIMVGKISSVFTAHIYYVFLTASILASFPSMTTMQSVLVIAMEITQPEKRAALAQIQNFGWCLSMVLMSLICWAIPDWSIFLMVTSAPLVFFVFAYGMMIESPRWLAGRGKIKRCIEELNKIAKTNGTVLEPELILQLQETTKEPEKIYGIMSTLSSWRLAKNTFIIVLAWVICAMCYFTIILNTTNLQGNPFLNFLLQSTIELPAYLVGKVLCDKIGRRFSGFISLLLSLITFIPVIFIIGDENQVMAINSLMIGAKFFISMTFYVVTLETMELFPTCLRQTGMSFGTVVSSAFGALGPYIVYLGTAVDARYPYMIMGALCTFGCITQLFLPETLHAKLPETLHEAKVFGMNQSFFSIPRKQQKYIISEEIKFINHHS